MTEEDLSSDSLCDVAIPTFTFDKNPFTYPTRSIHIECDFIGGQSMSEIDIPVQDVSLCTGKPNFNGLIFCVEPGDMKLLYIWRNCNGGKTAANYLHCLHQFLTTYRMGAGHLTISHDRGGHLHNQIVMRYYQLLTSPSSRKGERLFYDIEVFPYSTGHSGMYPDRISCLLEHAFRRRKHGFFTLHDRLDIIRDDFPGIYVHVVEDFINIPEIMAKSGVYLSLATQPDLTVKGNKGIGLIKYKPLSWEFGWSEKYCRSTDVHGYRRHPNQVWIRNSIDDKVQRRKFWLVHKKWRGKTLPAFFRRFKLSKLTKPGMKYSMYMQMKRFASVFAASREDVQTYWNNPPAVLHGTPLTNHIPAVSIMPTAHIEINSSSTSFGSYIDACTYGVELSSFLEARVEEEDMKMSEICDIGSNDSEGRPEIGDESDYIDDEGPESEWQGRRLLDSNLQYDSRSSANDLREVNECWLSTPLLKRYSMKISNFMVSTRSSIPLVTCKGSIKTLSVAQFREEVSGTTCRIKLCKEHGLSYRGGKQLQIMNILDHYCEYHGWGDTELDELNDIFIPHIRN